MTIESLRNIVSDLHRSANALAALGVALDARISETPLDPMLDQEVSEIIASLGVEEALDNANPAELRAMRGEIRTYTLTNAKALFVSSRARGWSHTEPDLLQAAGEVSVTVPHSLKNVLAPRLEGLTERLSAPDAAVLDIGVGVAAMSIELARVWPSVRVVGIDVWAPALECARRNVRFAGLESRIELRQQRAEELPDVDAFDLIWIPSLFLPEGALPVIARRVLSALRPGGWVLCPTMKAGGDRLASALLRLRVAMFGGFITRPEETEALLSQQGFADVQRMPGPMHAIAVMIAARKPGV